MIQPIPDTMLYASPGELKAFENGEWDGNRDTKTRKKRSYKKRIREGVMSFPQAVRDMELCGYLIHVYELEHGVYAAGIGVHGWNVVAEGLAERLPGQVRPSGSGGGITWINGNSEEDPAPQGIIVDAQNLSRILHAREVVDNIPDRRAWKHSYINYGGSLLNPNRKVWSLGACARICLNAIGDPMPYDKAVEGLLHGISYGYHDCKPGVYKDVTQYDVSAYYYDMLTRLETLKIDIDNSGIIKHPMSDRELGVWRDIKDAVETCKPLRNSLAGACSGSIRRGRAYCFDHDRQQVIEIRPPGTPGRYRGAGLLLVRTGWELCRLEALTTQSVYATIDSVATESGTPEIWAKHGFSVSRVAKGEAHICHRGSYRIGNKQTVWYHLGYHDTIPVAPATFNGTEYHKLWL